MNDTQTMTFTRAEAEDLSRALLFFNVTIRQDKNHVPSELARFQALYERAVDLNYAFDEEVARG